MTIDELSQNIRSVSIEKEVQRLADLLYEWKRNDQTVKELSVTIERYVGHSWFADKDHHNRIYELWFKFRDNAISGIDGMTMNERLYCFGLFDEFDACQNEESKLRIYKKLMAKL